MVTQRFIKIPQTVLHPLLALHRLEMPFINKPGAKAETKLIVVSRRRDDCEDLPARTLPTLTTWFPTCAQMTASSVVCI